MYDLGDVIGIMICSACAGLCLGGLITLRVTEKELDEAKSTWFDIGELTGRINERCEIIKERHDKAEKTSNNKKAKRLRAE